VKADFADRCQHLEYSARSGGLDGVEIDGAGVAADEHEVVSCRILCVVAPYLPFGNTSKNVASSLLTVAGSLS
jgi:hypothetical protein